jgi:PAS domain S-box-containing protein
MNEGASKDGVERGRECDALEREIAQRARTESTLREREEQFRALLSASSEVLYRMSPDWTEMRQLSGGGFLSDTVAPERDWAEKYIPPQEQPRVHAAIQDAVRNRRPFELEHQVRRNDGSTGWTLSRAVPRIDAAGEIKEWIGAASDVTARKEAEQALRESEELLRQFGDASSDLLWIRNAETLQLEYLSPAFETIYGVSRELALAGDNLFQWAELILPEDRARALQSVARVRENERVSFEFRIRRPRDGAIRWLRNHDFPMVDAAGSVCRIGGIARDVTALKSAVEHQQLLLGELQHRVRNTLAVIRSIVRRTAERSETIDDFFSHLDGRIDAFSRVQVAVTRDPLAGFDLAELVSEELRVCAAREGEQFTVEGPQVRLKAKAAESIGLAIHELATNALKHGAYTSDRGHVGVRWWKEQRDSGPWLSLEWKESGMEGHTVEQGREGFGTVLLQQSLPYDLGAEVTRSFEPSGFRCTIGFPFEPNASFTADWPVVLQATGSRGES